MQENGIDFKISIKLKILLALIAANFEIYSIFLHKVP